MKRILLLVLSAATACVGQDPPPQTEAAERIVVSGASGELGGLVVEELLALGVSPRDLILVSRTPERLAGYAEMGASTRFGDFTQPESLDAAYEGGTRLLLISLNTRGNPNPRVASERQLLHQAAIDAAVRAGVDHIVYTSIVNAADNPAPVAVDHAATEDMLRRSGIAWTSLRNQLYEERLVWQAVDMVASGRAVVWPDDPGVAYVTRRDCARAAAAVLTTDGHENRIYEVTGPVLVRTADIARGLSESLGVEIDVVDADPQPGTSSEGPIQWATTLTSHFSDITGRTPAGLEEVLQEYADSIMGR